MNDGKRVTCFVRCVVEALGDKPRSSPPARRATLLRHDASKARCLVRIDGVRKGMWVCWRDVFSDRNGSIPFAFDAHLELDPSAMRESKRSKRKYGPGSTFVLKRACLFTRIDFNPNRHRYCWEFDLMVIEGAIVVLESIEEDHPLPLVFSTGMTRFRVDDRNFSRALERREIEEIISRKNG